MIISMEHFSFLIYHKEYKAFLYELRDIGVVHIIEKKNWINKENLDKYELIKEFKSTIKYLKNRKTNTICYSKSTNGFLILDDVNKLRSLLTEYKQLRADIEKKINDIEPWGDFSIEVINRLADNGIRIRFFTCLDKLFNPEWESLYNLEVIHRSSNIVYFIVLHKDSDNIDINVEEVKLEKQSLSALRNDLKSVISDIYDINRAIDGYTNKCIGFLESSCNSLEESYDYDMAFFSGNKTADDKLIVLEGWVPQSKIDCLISYLEDKRIVYSISLVNKGDSVPILLSNNRFTRLFEWIGKLFSLPAYVELDLTVFFAPFFIMFFGFCLGDGGYGLILFLFVSTYKFWAKEDIKVYLSMVQLLSLSAVFFGMLSGTFFGIPLIGVNIGYTFLTPNIMFNLALVIGIIQVIFAIILRIVNIIIQRGFIYSLSSIGWLGFVLSFILYFILPYFGISLIPLYLWITAIINIAVILLFTDPDEPVVKRFLKGLFSIYLSVTGFFGDVLSYIRLFALGLSSSILGLVINDIAINIKGSGGLFRELLFIIFLLIGHSLNIVISSLSAFVHPMRLTFVEFYKNVGFIGGGKVYKPFSKK